ncbi:capsular polysaccharide biosynthesis protein [Zobellella aerophila]|uniref:Capsular polysaccharide biosynthesis protein n=2 Tax=Zobellella aerophila TaxID=870480 RepID=A0ABP6V3E6_9GAMM
MKANTDRARQWATRRGLPFWQLEDGFIGYIGHPATGAVRLSLIVDEVGVYYDATRPSRLEQLIGDTSWWNPAWQRRTEALLGMLVTQGVTKYNCYGDNQLPAHLASQLDAGRPKVLVIDQTKDDPAVHLGLAGEHSFADMLAAARAENPGAQLIVRTHPDVLLGNKKGYLTNLVGDDMLLLADSINPFALMTAVDKVYTVTSQLGFEALLVGKPVVCFGAPFYAGWGLTDDRVAIERRGLKRSLHQLLAAAYLRYCRYADPITGERCELEDLLDLILVQRPPAGRVNKLYVVGFSLWRRRFAPVFLRRYADELTFVKDVSALPHGREPAGNNAVLTWGRKFEPELAGYALPVWRMEDGFLRSVGLGSDLRRPGSLVVDNLGMYYDPRTCSTVEQYLATHAFTGHELAQGERLIDHLREQALTKYNVGTQAALNWRVRAGDKPVILVPGQVDDDASIRLGSPFVSGNAALLQRLRNEHPEAFIVFKPHPDVVSGNRHGKVAEAVLATCVDMVECEADIVACLDECDAVHTLTSLTGLEALIRGKPVTVWGQPFYSGWGLTEDKHPVPRRHRPLPLAALVYATYAWYPTYIDWPTGLYSTPLRMAWRLEQERTAANMGMAPLTRWWPHRVRNLWEALRG